MNKAFDGLFGELSPDVEKANKKALTVGALAGLVSARFNEASAARQASGLTTAMLQCRRAQEGKPLTGLHVDPDIPLVYNITVTLTRGITAMLRDALQTSAENLFQLKATPQPDLPVEVQREILDKLDDTTTAMMSLGLAPQPTESLQEAVALVRRAEEQGKVAAAEAASNLAEIVRDEFVENGWRQAMHEGIFDLVADVGMVIKAPSTRVQRTKKWEGSRMVYVDKVIRSVERIAPVDIFIAPNAASVAKADYIIERRTATATDLVILAQEQGYDKDEIMRVLALHPKGWQAMDGDGVSMLLREPDYTSSITAKADTVKGYDVLCMYGAVSGAHLETMGVMVSDPLRNYESEICVIDGAVIRAVLNPDPSGRRPFHITSYDPVPGKVFGHSPATRLFDVQRAVTSLFVSLIGDSALAGLHIEHDPSKLHSDDRTEKSVIRPRMVRLVKTDNNPNARRAFDIFNVTPNTAAFREEMTHLENSAYDLVGVPRMALGQTTGAGTIGRTADGVKTMLNQMLKVLKSVLMTLETDIIEPIVQSWVDWHLQWTQTLDIQGDVAVRARGLTGLLEQADQVDDLQWALQSLSAFKDAVDPTTQQPYVPADAVTRVLYRLFKAKGIPTKGMFTTDYDSQDALAAPAGVPFGYGFDQAPAAPDTALATSQSQSLGTANGY